MHIIKLIDQIWKFGVVGGIAFAIDYSVLYILTEFFGVYYLLSACISFVVSLVFNYCCSMRYVFTRREDISRIDEFLAFVLLSVIGLAINELLMWIGASGLHVHYMMTKIFATAVVMIWNFVSRKIWLEKRGE